MGSSGKPKTTMAKLKREAALRERRHDKAARKQIRKQGQPYPDRPDDPGPDAADQDLVASLHGGPESAPIESGPEAPDPGSSASRSEAPDQASGLTASGLTASGLPELEPTLGAPL